MKLAIQIGSALIVAALAAWFATPATARIQETKEAPRVAAVATMAETAVPVALFWNAKEASRSLHVGAKLARDDDAFVALLAEARSGTPEAKRDALIATIDATGETPWKELVRVVALCRTAELKRVELLTP